MPKRAKDVMGKPIVSAATGEKLGVVADLLLDDTGHQLEGLVVQRGGTFNKTEDILPVASVQSIGPDVVVSRSNDLVEAGEWKATAIGVERRDAVGGELRRDLEAEPRRDAFDVEPRRDPIEVEPRRGDIRDRG